MKLYADFLLYKRLLRHARPYWAHVVSILLLSLVASPIALLVPLPLKIAVDSVIGSRPVPDFLDAVLPSSATASKTGILIVAASLFVLVALLSQLQEFGNYVLSTYTGEKLQLAFRTALFRRVQLLSLIYHDSRGTADSLYRIQHDAPSIQWIAVYGLTPFLTAGVTFAAMVYVTARINSQLAVVALAISPVLLLLTWGSGTRLRSRWRHTKTLESSALSVVHEVLTGLRVVKAFGQEDREQERFVNQSGHGMHARIQLAFLEGGFNLLVGLTIAAGSALVLFVGVGQVRRAAITLGELLLVMGYLTQLYVPLKTMSKSIGTLQSSLASAERALSLLDEPAGIVEHPRAVALPKARGNIELRNVSFDYGDRTEILTDISLRVEAGTRVGISGATGAGKTTLISLLTRFYDPQSGQILLDGIDLRDYKLADLRNQFAIVLQEPVLFSRSIAENISYARPGADSADIVAAAKAANVHDFIMGLPEGYETHVGERGSKLSGGERQRISLARAFLKDAPILILDEPTSSIDTKTEAAIMETMERLMRGRTAFLIAHRVSTLSVCDLRLNLEHGRIASVTEVA